MVDKIAEIISNRIIAVNGQGEDKEIYTYGLQILLNTLLSIGVVLLIGSAANELWGTVIFLFCYCSLRLFAGGLHVDTNNKCMSIFVGGYILVLCILKCVDITLKIDVIAILVLFNICILMWAPVDVPNNSIPTPKKRIMKKRAFFISLIITSVIFALLYNRYDIGKWAFAGVSWYFFILTAGKIKNIIYIRRHNNEKSHRKNL